MGATDTPTPSSRPRHSLIALIAILQARAMRERRERDKAERATKKIAMTEAKPKTRGWFR
ncbi:hypothetical protein [Brevundimonas sp.]|uniref:hypothetical protein n=1 Tax=Brevundimonas sp. TaxID=1871086 RepID=UPI0026327C8A|nr:hypothetical protein [Brevundimonas sp.]